jgi:hypothetical protein
MNELEKTVRSRKTGTTRKKPTSSTPATAAKSTRRAKPAESAESGQPERSRYRAITPEQRHQMIAEAAYARAEKRGFQGGSPEEDWLQAESEIDALLLRSRKERGA